MAETGGTKLWPFESRIALIAIPITWAVFAVLLAVTHTIGNWPGADAEKWIVLCVAGLSVIPIALVLVDYLAERKASVDIRGVKINFGTVVETRAEFTLPANIGIPGQIVGDSSPMQIVEVLQKTSDQEIAVLDIKEGDEWWITRLLVLAAGAKRAGNPKVIVFVGREENIDGVFLGWARPDNIVKVLLESKETYRTTYAEARRIAAQMALFRGQFVAPITNLDPLVTQYRGRPEYDALGDELFEQILMDRLRSFENPPDRLTLAELKRLFDPHLWKETIDLDSSMKKQISAFLKSRAPFVALVRERKYVSLLKQEVGERLILRQLVEPIVAPAAVESGSESASGS